jgi:hypothetical protein
MVKCGVLFEVRTGFLNNIWTSFGFKGLKSELKYTTRKATSSRTLGSIIYTISSSNNFKLKFDVDNFLTVLGQGLEIDEILTQCILILIA